MVTLDVFVTYQDEGKGRVPMTLVASVATWRETHAARSAVFTEARARNLPCTVRVYRGDALLLVQTQRGTL